MAVKWADPKKMAKAAEQKYQTLNHLLYQYGVNNITGEQFWGQMKQNGWGQDDIDQWTAEYYQREQEKEDAEQAKREERDGRARSSTQSYARGPRREEQVADRQAGQGREGGEGRSQSGEDRQGQARRSWSIENPREEQRFRRDTKGSTREASAFAMHLISKGYVDVAVTIPSMRRVFEERAGHGDQYDVQAKYPGKDGLIRFEIKGRRFEFSDRDSYPHEGFIIDRYTKEPPFADWYVGVSRDLKCATIINGSKREKWYKKYIYDTTKGYGGDVHYCDDFSLVRFVALEGND